MKIKDIVHPGWPDVWNIENSHRVWHEKLSIAKEVCQKYTIRPQLSKVT
jgi:hypothetical protein